MILKLDWDTEFFGYPVGKLELAPSISFDLSEFMKNADSFTLVYLISKEELSDLPECFHFADKKITFTRDTEKIESKNGFLSIGPFKENSAASLLELAMISGVYSRFNLDKNFTNNEYKKLYTKWVNESVTRNIAKDVFVYKKDNKILGFITLGEKNDCANIGLISVAEEGRGKGIGTLLIKQAIYHSFLSGYSKINVVTQMDNLDAYKLYKRNGFCITDISYIYHYWNK
jgi:dTDP-4-amino-4,6-dideoxy-D-galactose acyltransferase